MKGKKTVWALLLIAVCVMCTVLTGCGEEEEEIYADSPFTGSWKVTNCRYGEIDMKPSKVFTGDYILTCEADGTCIVTIGDEEQQDVWEPVKKGVMLSGDENMILTTNKKKTKLFMDYNGVTLTFSRVKAKGGK